MADAGRSLFARRVDGGSLVVRFGPLRVLIAEPLALAAALVEALPRNPDATALAAFLRRAGCGEVEARLGPDDPDRVKALADALAAPVRPAKRRTRPDGRAVARALYGRSPGRIVAAAGHDPDGRNRSRYFPAPRRLFEEARP